ncbi:MAG: Coenzyme F420 hydrogenase/dehydrogenase, beta subunit C-terminal domain [Candidatus Bathyarchaeota archaeon]|nr:MAG: Coenzyme F420 hydrogenase/dehydrogenase, beta subunit C-terminal domain [Candidatus Bathyarchaeota archaeon]
MEETRTFKDLTKEVVERGICGKCGGCVSFCSAGELNALEMGENDLPRYINEDNCQKCGICYLICPQTDMLNTELREKFGWKAPIGDFQRITSAQTTNKEVKEICTDGGVVTSLLLYLLDRNLINGAVVSKKTGRFARKSIIARTPEELVEAAGSTFSGSLHLEELGGKYTTYTPILSTVKSLEKKYLRNIAVVGTPCQINAIRKMQCLGILPAHLIKYTIGLFCIENFSFDDVAREKLEKKLDINLEDIVKLNVKDDLIISLTKGVTIHVPLEEIHEVARSACFACRDFSNEYADISVGGLGSLDGYTTVLTRTGLGASLYDEALRRGYIRETTYEEAEESRLDKARMLTKIVSLARTKRMRADERLSKLSRGKIFGGEG